MGLVQKLGTEEAPLEITLEDEGATAALATALAAMARSGDVLALWGGLGTGKTAFARAFINALALKPEDVPSPTFTLVQVYDTAVFPLYHFDLYRLE
ncbi:MAG TPA: tRNA (adenosine(37)-N6)-threonylcarbamoyltransferase complex ATPase subunit type 1 TsaE, partial [Rhodospirillales bacterium]|nr:tRNA (adenosine(37)-N6)-threonylcarbamoyltransferase complex ATPase subunit type 1 TsaE [Rhodospirillales bacterium]